MSAFNMYCDLGSPRVCWGAQMEFPEQNQVNHMWLITELEQ